jgi:hypothetical protein
MASPAAFPWSPEDDGLDHLLAGVRGRAEVVVLAARRLRCRPPPPWDAADLGGACAEPRIGRPARGGEAGRVRELGFEMAAGVGEGLFARREGGGRKTREKWWGWEKREKRMQLRGGMGRCPPCPPPCAADLRREREWEGGGDGRRLRGGREWNTGGFGIFLYEAKTISAIGLMIDGQ